MVAETVLKELNIDKGGTYGDDGAFVVDIKNSDEFGKIYSKLDNTDLLEYQDENSLLTSDNANLNYIFGEGEFLVSLIGDFENDSYQLTITEI